MCTINLDVSDSDVAVNTTIGNIHSHVSCFDGGYGGFGHRCCVVNVSAYSSPCLTVQTGFYYEIAAIELRV